uniref:Uncharacterized protein n=1 Tax=uncultured prokaryote TaxID=198431 RepID=A0A0H5Q639_9ZZZZ|nr:hypothetical protein [uncultured prokaryote]
MNILEPIKVGKTTFKNRIMFPPLTTGYEERDGSIGYLLAVLILKFVYPLTKEKTAEMLAELAGRRKGAAND